MKRIANVPFVELTPSEAVLSLANFVQEGKSGHFHFVCASSIYYAESSIALTEVFGQAAGNFADGKSIMIASSLMGKHIPQVRGPKFFIDVMDQGRNFGLRHFLIGSSDIELLTLKLKLESEFPGIEIAGTFSPSRGETPLQELQIQDQQILVSKANVIWLGISTPKQDFEARRLAAEIKRPVIAVGAAFDFYTGAQTEAPRILQFLALEWLFRLFSNPKRLWKRYLIGNLVFIKAVFKYAFQE